jgi:trk system potassium uptake protein
MENHLKVRIGRDKLLLFSYFTGVIFTGALLLVIPGVFRGDHPLSFVDALFTSTSAVCVTGLTVVDTAQYTKFGQIVIMLLIQSGGLGIIMFATLYITMPRRRISIVNKGVINDYFLPEVEYQPKAIIRSILSYTFVIEAIGATLYFTKFAGKPYAVLNSLFHSVSAFCNAGFSTYSNNLESFVTDPIINLTTAGLIIFGGLGFVVIKDIRKYLEGEKHHLAVHSKIVLKTTAFLIVGGTIAFFVLEYNSAMIALTWPQKLLASFFQAVTPRTAGFDTIPQNQFTQGSVLITMILMFIGASPASTGGGIKTTTFFVILFAAFKYRDSSAAIRYGNRSISPSSIYKAIGILVKGVLIVSTATILIVVSESISGNKVTILASMFDSISAFATVGLTLGITPTLNDFSKIVLIAAMYIGRVGLFAFALPKARNDVEGYASLPSADILLG